jgi:drug/metabolite transporter (DMT)-like permease
MVNKHIYLISPTFILIWSSGFIVSRMGMPYCEPMTYLFLRFMGVCVLMLPIIFWKKLDWPNLTSMFHIAIAGSLIQCGYVAGVWISVKAGMPVGLASLIVGLQPILTALLAYFIAERVTSRQWVGLVLGLLGVVLVLYANLHTVGVTLHNILWNVFALISITIGTIYQKKYCPSFDLRIGSFIQFATSATISALGALLFETREIQWTAEMIGSLIWSVLGISIGAISLLFILIRRGDATKVSSIMYLTPPTTAILAWLIFNEPLTPLIILGTVITALGVLLVNQSPPSGFLRSKVKDLK